MTTIKKELENFECGIWYDREWDEGFCVHCRAGQNVLSGGKIRSDFTHKEDCFITKLRKIWAVEVNDWPVEAYK